MLFLVYIIIAKCYTLQGKNETKTAIVNRPHDTREGIVLVRDWLNSGMTDVKQFNNGWKQQTNNKGQFTSDVNPTSYRSIAKFLSKNGKAVSHVTVKNYLVESPM